MCTFVCARACVCVCVCVYSCASLGCPDVSSLGNNLSRCFVFRQGGLVCVCVLLCEPWLSRCFVFRQQLTCQDMSSLGRGALHLFVRALVVTSLSCHNVLHV